MSDETTFVQWKDRAKDERDTTGGGKGKIILVSVVAVILVIAVIALVGFIG